MSDDEWEECDFSGLAKAFCAHCKGHTLGDEKGGPSVTSDDLFNARESDHFEVEYELIGHKFKAMYPGTCTVNYDHSVRRGDLVSKVQRADNPMIPITGVACKECTRMLPDGG